MYIISLWLYRIVNTEFLAPNPRALDTLGWKDARKIKKRNQVYRFVTPVFLHASFVHLTLNILSTVIIGSGLENGLGCWKLGTLYFVSSFGGVLFSCVFNPMSYSVGASTAIFGLIGYYIAYLCIEWSRLGESNPMQRFTLIIFILLILLFNIQIGLTEANVDNLGHLGGLIVGIIMGFAIAENDERRDRSQGIIDFFRRTNYKNKCGIIFLFSYLLVFILVFYLVIEV
jgi:rhomboid protease GluP